MQNSLQLQFALSTPQKALHSDPTGDTAPDLQNKLTLPWLP